MSKFERTIVYPSSAGRCAIGEADWEAHFGDAGDRAARVGRHGLRFREYFNGQLEQLRSELRSGYRATRSAQEERERERLLDMRAVAKKARVVEAMGRQSFLLQGFPPEPSLCAGPLGGVEAAADDAGEDAGAPWSGSSPPLHLQQHLHLQQQQQQQQQQGPPRWSLPPRLEQALARESKRNPGLETAQEVLDRAEERARARCETAERNEAEANSSDDEDWDTSGWLQGEIEAAVETLVEEVRSSPQLKRRRIATAMLCRLLCKHRLAANHLDLLIPSLADKALFINMGGTRRSPECARLSHLLSVVAQYLPDKLSRYACAKKSASLLARKHVLAANLLQAVWRRHAFEQRAAALPPDQRSRRRAMFVLVAGDLVRQWQRFVVAQIGLLTLSEQLAQLRMLLGMCADGNAAFRVKDRRYIVERGGLHPAQQLLLSPAREVRWAAAHLLYRVAEDAELQPDMLHAGCHWTLTLLMQSELVEDRLLALDVVDLLVGSACFQPREQLAEVWARVHDPEWRKVLAEPVREDEWGKVYDRGRAPSSLMRRVDPTWRGVDCALLLAERRRDGGLLRWLKQLLCSDDDAVRLGASLCLLKLASGAVNPRIVCAGERLTVQELRANAEAAAEVERLRRERPDKAIAGQASPYEVRRRERVKLLVHSLVHNIADAEVPGLSVVSLQLVAQLAACETSRAVLVEESLPEHLLLNLCSAIRLETPDTRGETPSALPSIPLKPRAAAQGEAEPEAEAGTPPEPESPERGLAGDAAGESGLAPREIATSYTSLSSSSLGDANSSGSGSGAAGFRPTGQGASLAALRRRGLLALTCLAGSAARPLHLLGTAESDIEAEGVYRWTLDLDIFASEYDLDRCLECSLLALVSQREEVARAATERLLFEFRALPAVLDMLFVDRVSTPPRTAATAQSHARGQAGAASQAEVERICVMAVLLGRLCRLAPQVVPSLTNDVAVRALTRALHCAHAEQRLAALPATVRALVQAAAESASFALCCIARQHGEAVSSSARWMVGATLALREPDSARVLVSLVSRGSKTGRDDLAVFTAQTAAVLIGSLVPWQGLEAEATTDLLSATNVPELDELDEALLGEGGAGSPSAAFSHAAQAVGAEAAAARVIRARGRAMAKKAVEEGVTSSGVTDVRSALPSPEAKELVRALVALAGNRLVRALRRSEPGALQSALCFALARLCSTAREAQLITQSHGVMSAVEAVLPGSRLATLGSKGRRGGDSAEAPSSGEDEPAAASAPPAAREPGNLNNNNGAAASDAGQRSDLGGLPRAPLSVSIPENQYADALAAMPASFFTMCAGVARTLDGKLRMIASGAARAALDCLCLLHGDASAEALKVRGEAALLLARVANVNHPVYGSANELILTGRDNALRHLVALATEQGLPLRVRLHAALATAQLAQDRMRVVPRLLHKQGLRRVAQWVRELESDFLRALEVRISDVLERPGMVEDLAGDAARDKVAAPALLLRQALRVLYAISTHMIGTNHDALLAEGIEPVLQRLALAKDPAKAAKLGGNPLTSQPTLADLATAVLEDLRLTLQYGSALSRQINTAPANAEEARPLTAAFMRDGELVTDFARDPFDTRGHVGAVLNPATGQRELATPQALPRRAGAEQQPAPASAAGRIESRRLDSAGRPASPLNAVQSPGRRPLPPGAVAVAPPASAVDSAASADRFGASKASASAFRQHELVFSSVLAPSSEPQHLLWTRPTMSKPSLAPEELRDMHDSFLLATRPPGPRPPRRLSPTPSPAQL